MPAQNHPEVLVVGAGPVGLFAALTLARQGVAVQIVDREWRTGAHSYALALHPSSLRLLDELGLLPQVLERAYRVDKLALYDGRQLRQEVDLATLGGPHSFLAVLPQDALERIFETALEELGVEVLWNHEVASLVPQAEQVDVTVQELQKESVGYAVAHTEWVVGRVSQWRVPFVLGADGHRSLVRRTLGLEFAEVKPAQNFAVFEFRSPIDLAHQMQLSLADRLTNALWPLPDGYCRWSFQLGDIHIPVSSRQKRRVMVEIGSAEYPVLDASHLEVMLAQRAPWFQASVEELRWQIAVRFESRLVSRFGQGRLWLLGDAAHMTGPAGMQSMNVGLREAYELAQQVTAILRGQASPDVLETYHRQQTAQWRELLGLNGGLKASDQVAPWLRDSAEALLPCLPASGAELVELAGQLGFLGRD